MDANNEQRSFFAMFRSLGSVALRGSLAAVAIGAVVLSAQEARAACIGGDSVCTTFDPTTASTPTGVGGFTGGGNALATYTKAKLRLTFTGTTTPQTFSNFLLSGQGITTPLTFGNLTASTSGTRVESAFVNLDSSVSGGSLNFSQNTISFQIPAGIALGSSLIVDIQYADALENNINTSVADFTTTAATSSSVPGPLPLLGAGAAFGFSRTLRKRIKASAKT
jgi:hypothetical protein